MSKAEQVELSRLEDLWMSWVDTRAADLHKGFRRAGVGQGSDANIEGGRVGNGVVEVLHRDRPQEVTGRIR